MANVLLVDVRLSQRRAALTKRIASSRQADAPPYATGLIGPPLPLKANGRASQAGRPFVPVIAMGAGLDEDLEGMVPHQLSRNIGVLDAQFPTMALGRAIAE
jgi:hypothetical protein